MRFGGQTVTVITYTPTGVTSALGKRQKSETLTEVPGCHHRPMTFTESPHGDTNVATETWQTTAPPHPAVLVLKAGDAIRVDGMTYQVIGGAQPHADHTGRPFKVTLTSQRQTG